MNEQGEGRNTQEGRRPRGLATFEALSDDSERQAKGQMGIANFTFFISSRVYPKKPQDNPIYRGEFPTLSPLP